MQNQTERDARLRILKARRHCLVDASESYLVSLKTRLESWIDDLDSALEKRSVHAGMIPTESTILMANDKTYYIGDWTRVSAEKMPKIDRDGMYSAMVQENTVIVLHSRFITDSNGHNEYALPPELMRD